MPGKNRLLYLCAALNFCVGCSGYTGIVRDTVPERRIEVDISADRAALIRTADCDITVMQISAEKWERLASTRIFAKKEPADAPRIIPYELFQIVMTNSAERTVSSIDFASRYSGNRYPGEKTDAIIKRCSSPVYKNISFEKMCMPRRILTERVSPEAADLDNDSLEYPFPFILPLDTISFIAAFPQIPPDIRNYTVTVSYTVDSVKKNVDFRFMRLERRDKE